VDNVFFFHKKRTCYTLLLNSHIDSTFSQLAPILVDNVIFFHKKRTILVDNVIFFHKKRTCYTLLLNSHIDSTFLQLGPIFVDTVIFVPKRRTCIRFLHLITELTHRFNVFATCIHFGGECHLFSQQTYLYTFVTPYY